MVKVYYSAEYIETLTILKKPSCKIHYGGITKGCN